MIDSQAVIRTALLTVSPLTTLVGSRIWPARVDPIAGYKPADGGAIAFRNRGGGVLYRGGLQFPSVQFKCWGVTEEASMAVYRALYDALETNPGAIRSAVIEVLGQPANEQETGWPFVLGFWTIWLDV